ncbi:TetR/AcrR family transcriptional regulator [Streptomyces sp. AC512_CC834]|uniref:TetR/AcrR family transcriptional regulator n=1 Tax=Streptomyces sp. AC512_CC834 TaxID=2823691 RepID=UPI001C264FCC|nr:TetR/AcrR family transcriptional regulator [Streptomyces sp. AC512_CC834]
MTSDRRGLQPRKQPRQVRAELTRQRILAAAAHVFAEYGYAAGTTNRIAERARVSIGSLYQYYPNKDAILVELLTRHLDTGITAVRRRRSEGLPDSLEGILRAHVRTAIDNHRHDPNLLRVMFEQAPRSPELIERISRQQRELVDYVHKLFDEHPEVRVADTHVAARLAVSTVELVVHQLIAEPDPIDIPRFENELVAMLVRYLRGAPSPEPAAAAAAGERADGSAPIAVDHP